MKPSVESDGQPDGCVAKTAYAARRTLRVHRADLEAVAGARQLPESLCRWTEWLG